MANEFKVKKGLIVIGSGSNILDIQGSQGQLFSVTDSLSGSLFSVNDVSGLPILKVFSDDSVRLGTFNNEAIIVSGNTSKITGSLFGTATTASSVSPLNQNVQITGSLNVTGSVNINNLIKLTSVVAFPSGQAGMLVASASYGKTNLYMYDGSAWKWLVTGSIA